MEVEGLIEYTAGYCDITPNRAVSLAGYAARVQPFEGIHSSLEANALIARSGKNIVVLVSLDLLFVGSELRERLEKALVGRVFPEGLFLAASHTHFAPATDMSLPKLGQAEQWYVDFVYEKILSLINSLLEGPFRPMKISRTRCLAEHVVNRRRRRKRLVRRYPFIESKVSLYPNPQGYTDQTVTTFNIDHQAVIWNFSCHPVFMPEMNHVSADFVGYVRDAVRKQLGPETPVLFFQGFSGNLFPSYSMSMFNPITKIFKAPMHLKSNTWTTWCNSLSQLVVDTLLAADPVICSGNIVAQRKGFPIARILSEERSRKEVMLHYLTLGPAIKLLGVSAEVVAEYVPILRQLFNDNSLMCVGCIDGVYGYYPSDQMLKEGGYEVEGFLPYFSLKGTFNTGMQNLMSEELKELMRENV